MKTIVAPITPLINSAVHAIRISGDKSYEIINKISSEKVTKEGYKIQHIKIIDENKNTIDDVLVLKFVAPKSFTGEDVIEINCHGGNFVTNKIISLLVTQGCEMANPGDFSKRAFLNNKISINEADAINNIINAPSLNALLLANNAFNSKITKVIQEMKDKLFLLIGQVEVNIDYPEYDDIPQVSLEQMKNILTELSILCKKIIDESKLVEPIKDGFNVSIVGMPNVGKSSLLNAILKEERVIVSDIPGTTRDVVESKINIGGFTFNFLDTAGIRESENSIEKIGIKKTKETIEKSDLILFLVDGSKELSNDDLKILDSIKHKQYITVVNKSDLGQKSKIDGIKISAKNNEVQPVVDELLKQTKQIDFNDQSLLILQSKTSINFLERAYIIIQESINSIKNKIPIDLLMEPLKEAHQNFLSILGEVENFDFINEMFSKFCLGK